MGAAAIIGLLLLALSASTVYFSGAWKGYVDSDWDGVNDAGDKFPNDASEWADGDSDGFGDNSDAFPNNSTEWLDSDWDNRGDNSDAFPNDASEWLDSDDDGRGDNSDVFKYDPAEWLDSDADGRGDNSDAFPNNSAEWLDSDSDGFGDNSDAFPNNSTEWLDSDGDGHGDNSDAFPNDSREWADTDNDTFGDNEDAFPNNASEHFDSDRDGYGDSSDVLPYDPTEWLDSDGDGYGDNSDSHPHDAALHGDDSDGDGLMNDEEEALGTDMHNPDTDRDSVPDGIDRHPNGGDRSIPKTFQWIHAGYRWTMEEDIKSDLFDYYEMKTRPQNYAGYVTYEDYKIEEIAENIHYTAERRALSFEGMSLAFVQSLPYIDDFRTGFDEYPKYPIQTLVDGSGDCEDTSYLTATLLKAKGVDVVLLTFFPQDKPGHMAVGIDCACSGQGFNYDGKVYYYAETTGEGWDIGEMPDDYDGVAPNIYTIP